MSGIQWTDQTWNPVVGCTPVSPGCLNCYAAAEAPRLGRMGARQYVGVTVARTERGGDRRDVFNGTVRTVGDQLGKPLRRKKPTRYFIASMGDLFHEAVPFGFIDQVFAVMALCPQHTFQVLTKRPERMAEYLNGVDLYKIGRASESVPFYKGSHANFTYADPSDGPRVFFPRVWPLPNVWLGTSAEDQARLDERVPHLLRCPAVVRFLSCEPLLRTLPWLANAIGPQLECPCGEMWIGGIGGPLDACPGCRSLVSPERPRIDWVIVGGESGPQARPCRVDAVRSVVRQCRTAGVPVFVKQLGSVVWDRNDAGFDGDPGDAWDENRTRGVIHHPDGDATVYQGAPVRVLLHDRKGGDLDEWPEDLRVREFPKVEVTA